MPRTPIKYTNTHVYKIVCKDLTIKECYVGHTTDFKTRKTCHKSCCTNVNSNRHYSQLYQFIRNNNGWDNFGMIAIETRTCNNALDAKKVERHCIEELNVKLNMTMPSISHQ